MTVVYDIFADWEDSFFVQDLKADDLPLTAEQKKFSILGIIVEPKDDVDSIYNIVRTGIDAHVYGIIIDFHFLNGKKELTEIIELLEKSGYMNTESYEFKLGYFRNWQFDDLGWMLEKTMYQSEKYRRVCKPLDWDSLEETLSAIPVKSYEREYDEIKL